ncbi:uncharacterized protein TRIVIDRAFT_220226 [Trichoderma virens Gv29-8]|uniref:Peptidase S9 prolyl oligopeptidase catalytic domain-containing protein n=1 Tax=Hypocrea virens (strain Gv29-8 / FGSC 10586) TaxID=413071 RepID=G9MKN9_HYPVG|nr:uncharacterized protein TRIVIDRAFT_220226 [Trichoderma virens Gv29-8]EHK24786.1 hypothetical protein TRIVIDRAFT_220226 [Trichoderma virens Gv29-8]
MPVREIPEYATASFIFLPDMKSSGKILLSEIEQENKPHRLNNILKDVRCIFYDAPYRDPPATADGMSRRPADDPCAGNYWYTSDDPIGADETATAIQWMQLSYDIKWLEEMVRLEARFVGRENVFIVGFGTGFGIAAATVFQMEERIGGLLGVHPVMPFHVDLKYIALDGQTKAVVNAWSEMEKKRKEEGGQGEEEMEEDFSDVDGAGSEASARTLCVNDGNDQTHEARLGRLMGLLRYLVDKGEVPTFKRVCDRSDASTPVILLHGMDDKQVHFSYAKDTVQTFWNLGYKAKLDIMEDEGHKLSRMMLRELFTHFVKLGLGNEATRSQIQHHL